eukprot:217950-Prorocentrum_minimum.AAC.1
MAGEARQGGVHLRQLESKPMRTQPGSIRGSDAEATSVGHREQRAVTLAPCVYSVGWSATQGLSRAACLSLASRTIGAIEGACRFRPALSISGRSSDFSSAVVQCVQHVVRGCGNANGAIGLRYLQCIGKSPSVPSAEKWGGNGSVRGLLQATSLECQSTMVASIGVSAEMNNINRNAAEGLTSSREIRSSGNVPLAARILPSALHQWPGALRI